MRFFFKGSRGFSLMELLVVIVILGIVYTVVYLQITNQPIERARDDVRKSDINYIAETYIAKATDKDTYEPLTEGDATYGRIPVPPEGGSYQGLLTQPQDFFTICAQLEKGKDINCLANLDNPNCYCRQSHIVN